jgi:predicted HTH domain antitoxin
VGQARREEAGATKYAAKMAALQNNLAAVSGVGHRFRLSQRIGRRGASDQARAPAEGQILESPLNKNHHAALEVLVVEGYRSGAFSHYQASQLPGLSRLAFEGFLKERNIYEHAYSADDRYLSLNDPAVALFG